jgi:hypothetical protein
VVEHLVTTTGARLCAWAGANGMAVLPHYSPGYPDWPIEEQAKLLGLLNPGPEGPGLRTTHLRVLPSGMLHPKKSLLAVFGLTRRIDLVRPLSDLVPCENCSFGPCAYRRAPYKRAAPHVSPELVGLAATNRAAPPPKPQYTVNLKALERWRHERLALDHRTDGGVDALFRFEGTTCTNMGRPLKFEYRVSLGPRSEGYPIRGQFCGPAADDDGYTYMCKYISAPDVLIRALTDEQPLHGRPLDEVLAWERPPFPAGCYCDAASRQHKWGLVLETIHYALRHPE